MTRLTPSWPWGETTRISIAMFPRSGSAPSMPSGPRLSASHTGSRLDALGAHAQLGTERVTDEHNGTACQGAQQEGGGAGGLIRPAEGGRKVGLPREWSGPPSLQERPPSVPSPSASPGLLRFGIPQLGGLRYHFGLHRRRPPSLAEPPSQSITGIANDGQASNALIRCSTDQLIGADNARSTGCSRSALRRSDGSRSIATAKMGLAGKDFVRGWAEVGSSSSEGDPDD